MKGGLMLAVEAFRRIAQASRRTKLPITFLFTPDEELSSPVSRRVIEREARGQRYVLVTEPARDGGRVVTERKGIGVFVIRTRGRPAHAGGDPDKGRNAIVAMAEIVLALNGLNDPRRGITTNVGLICASGNAANVLKPTNVGIPSSQIRILYPRIASASVFCEQSQTVRGYH